MKRYGSTSKISSFLIALYYAFILMVIVSLASNIMQLIFLESISVSLSKEHLLNANNSRLEIISKATYFLFIFITLIYTIWKYKSYKNLNSLGSGKLEFSPLWAVFIYFIPLYNFWMPYKAMRELSRSSKPEMGKTEDFSIGIPIKTPTPRNIKFWWALVLLSFLTGRVTKIVSHRVVSFSSLQYYTILSMFYDVVNIVLTVFTILVIREITKDQATKYMLFVSDKETALGTCEPI